MSSKYSYRYVSAYAYRIAVFNSANTQIIRFEHCDSLADAIRFTCLLPMPWLLQDRAGLWVADDRNSSKRYKHNLRAMKSKGQIVL